MHSAVIRLLLTVACGLLLVPGAAVAAVSPAANMAAARTQASAVAIPNGGTTSSVLVTGGRSNPGTLLDSTERYDPQTNTWVPALDMPAARAGHASFFVPPTGALTTASVVVVGGTIAGRVGEIPATQALRYDPTANSWTSGAGQATARIDSAATLITFRGNPQILVAGGQTPTPETVPTVETYDIVTDSWTTMAPMPTARRDHAAVTLPDGRVFVAGGFNANNGPLASAEIYNPATNSWTEVAVPSLSTPRARLTLSVVDGNHILASGGVNAAGTPIASAESYDPATNNWTPAGSMAVARYDHQATVVRSGWVVMTGGRGAGAGGLDSAESWTPTNGWGGPQALPGSQPLGGARVDHAAAAIPQSDEVLVAGGGVPSAVAAGTVTATAARWTPDRPVIVPPSTPPVVPPATPLTPPETPPTAVPVQNRSLVAAAISGNVFVRIGATDDYRELRPGEPVPVGTVLDTSDGRVQLVAAIGGKQQAAWFWGGTFTVLQPKKAGGYVEIRLFGKPVCEKTKSKQAARAVKRKKKPKVWGDGKGKFRTKGANSSASVSGTKWLVEERCTGTFSKVAQGRVKVRDFPKHKTIVLRAGKNYLARPARR